MDYKMLHGAGSRGVSSPSTAEGGELEGTGSLSYALPDGAFEVVEEVEGLLAGVGERAPQALVEPALGVLTSDGKRLRPLLVVLCARMGEPDRGDLLRAATAIEVLHTATLIHDDIVDKAEHRRGEPTTVARYGRETAIAAGDYLFAAAFSELGQYRASGATVDVEAYLEHIRKKTAGLFKAACVAGGSLGGLSLRQIDSLATYGQALGIAFQMSDDIMDLVGKPGLMGKGIGTDLAEGTMTLPVIFALGEGDAETIRKVLASPSPSPELLEAGIEAGCATEPVANNKDSATGEIDAALEGLDLFPGCPEREFLQVI